jgi:hypothetical protein
LKTNKNGNGKKDLIIKEPTPPATIEPQGRGFEEKTEREDLILPRAILLQALSPQLQDVDGLKAGMVINNITNEALPEKFIPILKYTEFLKFNPRDSKDESYDPAYEPGALIWRTNDPSDPRTVECKFGEDGSKPTALKVMNFLCYFPGVLMPIVLGFSKTSYKAGKKLISLAKFTGGDLFGKVYALKVKQAEKNGIKYFVLDVGMVSKANKDDFSVAEAWYGQFKGKDIKVHDEGAGSTGDPAIE